MEGGPKKNPNMEEAERLSINEYQAIQVLPGYQATQVKAGYFYPH